MIFKYHFKFDQKREVQNKEIGFIVVDLDINSFTLKKKP